MKHLWNRELAGGSCGVSADRLETRSPSGRYARLVRNLGAEGRAAQHQLLAANGSKQIVRETMTRTGGRGLSTQGGGRSSAGSGIRNAKRDMLPIAAQSMHAGFRDKLADVFGKRLDFRQSRGGRCGCRRCRECECERQKDISQLSHQFHSTPKPSLFIVHRREPFGGGTKSRTDRRTLPVWGGPDHSARI